MHANIQSSYLHIDKEEIFLVDILVEKSVLGYDAVQSVENLPKLRINISSPSSVYTFPSLMQLCLQFLFNLK
jgi:hypothetical protein